MIERLLNEDRAAETLVMDLDTGDAVELIFTGILGACVVCSSDTSMQPWRDRSVPCPALSRK
jgi:hypothetical protein